MPTANVVPELIRGDNEPFLIRTIDDIFLGGTAYFTLKNDHNDADVDALIFKKIGIVYDSTSGYYISLIRITKEDTSGLELKKYYHDIQIVNAAGDIVKTVSKGKTKVVYDVTREAIGGGQSPVYNGLDLVLDGELGQAGGSDGNVLINTLTSGKLGVNAIDPARQAEIKDNDGDQLRLSTETSWFDFSIDPAGNVSFINSVSGSLLGISYDGRINLGQKILFCGQNIDLFYTGSANNNALMSLGYLNDRLSIISHDSLLDIGLYSHAEIDAHIDNSGLHFAEGSINHLNILNIGAYPHTSIDGHIDDLSVHYTKVSISHNDIADNGVYSHSVIDTHIDDITVHFTEASIDHANIFGIGVNNHTSIDSHLASASIHFTEASINHANIIGAGVYSHVAIDAHIDDNTIHYLQSAITEVGAVTSGTIGIGFGEINTESNITTTGAIECGTLKADIEILDNDITPPILIAHTDDWSPAGLSATKVVRIGTDGNNYELRGLEAQSSRILILLNVQGGDIKLKNESITSIASNRFLLNVDTVIKLNQAATIWHDPVDLRWRLIGVSIP